jgi:hypothetical protein
MKLYRLFTVTATVLALASTASAQSKGAGADKAPHVASSVPKGGNTTHGPKAGTSTGSGKSANAGSPKKSVEGSSHAKNSGAPTADAKSLATKISNNPAQLAKIQPQLDALGLTLDDATKGFRNQGQFIAALNAATHRNLDFVALQEAMTVDGLSLGQAAKKLQNAQTEPETAAAQAPAPPGTTTSPTGAPAQ